MNNVTTASPITRLLYILKIERLRLQAAARKAAEAAAQAQSK